MSTALASIHSVLASLLCSGRAVLLIVLLAASMAAMADAGATASHSAEAPQARQSTQHQQHARQILSTLWLRGRGDPDYLQTDIVALADYIASQPSAFALLEKLAGQALRIRYRPQAFHTRVVASPFSVHSATIYFDPRAAAVFSGAQCHALRQLCVASPADVFLHELLHASVALLEPSRFLRGVSPGSATYPYEHEREIIARERALFSAMSRGDTVQRPLRHSHSGELVTARCVTCVES